MESKPPKDRHQAAAYPLRLPDALKKHLMQSATKNQRSLNGEIVFRLEESQRSEVIGAQGAQQ